MPTQNGSANAFKILLGWCIVGSMNNQTKAGKFGYNRIVFASADRVKPGSHYFTLPTEVRKTSIKICWRKFANMTLLNLNHSIVLLIRSILIMIICEICQFIKFLSHWRARRSCYLITECIARKTIRPKSWNIIESSKGPSKYHLSINFLAQKKTVYPTSERFKTRTL